MQSRQTRPYLAHPLLAPCAIHCRIKDASVQLNAVENLRLNHHVQLREVSERRKDARHRRRSLARLEQCGQGCPQLTIILREDFCEYGPLAR